MEAYKKYIYPAQMVSQFFNEAKLRENNKMSHSGAAGYHVGSSLLVSGII